MLNLVESIRNQCADIDAALVEMHLRRLPPSYFERYAPAEIARHVRLVAKLDPDHPVEVAIRPLTSQAFDLLVVCEDRSGTIACVTALIAALGFNLEDVQVSTYLPVDSEILHVEPNYCVIYLRMSGSLPGRSLIDLAEEMRDRLHVAFTHLAQGNFLEAQAAAADVRGQKTEVTRLTPPKSAVAKPVAGHEGMLIGGDFRLQRKLAMGGMSEVYLATQLSLNRTVTVKLIRHESGADEDALSRFYQEGLVVGQFNCPHIVQIYAAGTVPARGSRLGWMAMEYMAGGDLSRWQRQQGCPNSDLALRWFREALEGLYYAHRRGTLHRDIKPHNLLLTSEGHLKVSDFGLLKQQRKADSGLTPQATIVGTPHYMSPEQALGEPLDERSDIFSLGTTFFHLLSGKLPFNRNSPTAVLVQIAREDAPDLAEAASHVPTPLTVIVQRMMARSLEERYQDVGVILEDLASYERRGLLRVPESGIFTPVSLPSEWTADDFETQAYHPGDSDL